jgi:hypothetical protein
MTALEKVATRIWRSRRNLVNARRGLPWMEEATAGAIARGAWWVRIRITRRGGRWRTAAPALHLLLDLY